MTSEQNARLRRAVRVNDPWAGLDHGIAALEDFEEERPPVSVATTTHRVMIVARALHDAGWRPPTEKTALSDRITAAVILCIVAVLLGAVVHWLVF